MVSLLISLCALILGYLFYGKLAEKIFGPDPLRPTPAQYRADGIDYIKMPGWKVFMIQFLNIAGTGPIFGAIMGAKFGPSAYLWIVFGCIFAGAVHDYFSGMLSVRHGGAGLPDLIGKYLGKAAKTVMLIFTVVLLILVGAVFVYSPAIILGGMTGGTTTALMIWIGVVFVYYLIATFMPIDKIIGRIYPLFAFSLLFMAVALFIGLLVKWPSLPEFWQGLGNRGPGIGLKGQPIFPCLFITIACGAISGFHATQSPLMARCMENEKLGRPIFYGSMITEGIVALIWAAISSYFFFGGGAAELGAPMSASAPAVVTVVSKSWLGVVSSTVGANPTVTFRAAKNEGGDREATVVFKTTDGSKEYSAQTTIKQKGAIIQCSIADFLAAPVSNFQYRLSGIITKIDNADNGNLYIKDYSGEVYVYGIGAKGAFKSSGLVEGDVVTLVGKRGEYKGTAQMTNAQTESYIKVQEKTISEFLAEPDDTGAYYKVSGTVDEIANDTYGNIYITDGTNRLYIYGCYPGWGATGDARKGAVATYGITVGSTLTVIGPKTTYNGTTQVKNAVYFSSK